MNQTKAFFNNILMTIATIILLYAVTTKNSVAVIPGLILIIYSFTRYLKLMKKK